MNRFIFLAIITPVGEALLLALIAALIIGVIGSLRHWETSLW